MAEAICHTQTQIAVGQIQAQQRHALRHVPILLPTICHVRRGEKRLYGGSEVVCADARHVILLPAGLSLSLENCPSADGYCADTVSFSLDLVHQFHSRYPDSPAALPRPAAASAVCVPLNPDSQRMWTHLLNTLADPHAAAALQQHALDGLLLALQLTGQAGGLLQARHDLLSVRVQQVLMAAPAAPWTVADVAKRLYVGASTLRRRLGEEGRPFRQLREEVRLGLALHWLQTTARPIGEIAADSGYASASRFAVRFRQHYGLSPRALRVTL